MKRIFELNTERIKRLLKEMDQPQAWLAEQVGIERQLLWYDLQSGCPNRVDRYAEALNTTRNNLIK